MKEAAINLIEETINKYSEYLDENIDPSNFLIHVLAAQLVEERKKNLFLSRTLIGMQRQEALNR